MEKIFDVITEFAATTGLKLLIALIVLLVGLKIIKVVVKSIAKGKGFAKIEPSVQSFTKSFLSISLKALLIIIVISILGVEMSSFAALFASAGVAVGLAMQGALSNFAGGLMILIFKPFKVGDYIDTHTDAGTVEEITVIYTILNTPDNKRITLPNGTLTNSSIVNYSANAVRRVDLSVAVDSKSDIEKVKGILLDIASSHSLVINEPSAPFVRLDSQIDQSLVFAMRAWCKKEDYWQIYHDFKEEIKVRFDENQIKAPKTAISVFAEDGSELVTSKA